MVVLAMTVDADPSMPATLGTASLAARRTVGNACVSGFGGPRSCSQPPALTVTLTAPVRNQGLEPRTRGVLNRCSAC